MVAHNESWHIIGASVTGTSHLTISHGCDDAHGYRLLEHDILLLAVADGAGTAVRSATGAATAVRVALETAAQLLTQQSEPQAHNQWQNILTFILHTTHNALALLVDESGSTPSTDDVKDDPSDSTSSVLRDYATTLLTAIVTKHWVAIVQVGDGAAVIQRPDGSFTSLTPRHSKEYINETDFITDTHYLDEAEYTILPRAGTQGIALLTDGLQMVAMKFPENTPYQPFFVPMFKFAASPEATEEALQHFLASERISERTDDDKTLVLAVYQ